MAIVTRQQLRLDVCWDELVKRFEEDPEEWVNHTEAAKFYSHLRKTVADIHNEGLAMALAFRAASDATGKMVCECLSAATNRVLWEEKEFENNDLLADLSNADSIQMMLTTAECTACAGVFVQYLSGANVKPAVQEDGFEGEIDD